LHPKRTLLLERVLRKFFCIHKGCTNIKSLNTTSMNFHGNTGLQKKKPHLIQNQGMQVLSKRVCKLSILVAWKFKLFQENTFLCMYLGRLTRAVWRGTNMKWNFWAYIQSKHTFCLSFILHIHFGPEDNHSLCVKLPEQTSVDSYAKFEKCLTSTLS
jgi:hypothetical protein